MLRLTTLRRVKLTGAGDPSVPHPILGRPKRLALLAHPAVAYPGSVAFRDGLLTLLWPEHDEPRARRALRQTLYHLRRELGDDVIVGGPGWVGVDPDRLWCDAVAFGRAIVEDRLEAALELCSGEFMRRCWARPRSTGLARRVDPQLPEAHLVLGACATLLDRDWDLAERYLRRGRRRGPDLPDSYWAWSNLLLITGRQEEGRQAGRRARELDPIAPTLWLNKVLIQVATGESRAAVESARRFAAFHRAPALSPWGWRKRPTAPTAVCDD